VSDYKCGEECHMFRASETPVGMAVLQGTVCLCRKRVLPYRFEGMQSLWLSAQGQPVDSAEQWKEEERMYEAFERVAERICQHQIHRVRLRLVLEAGSYIGALCALAGYILRNDPLFLIASVLLAAYAVSRKTWAFVTLNVVWGTFALERMLR